MILSTDLSAAYDTVDHEILVRKLFYYGIRGSELDFVISYLSNRSQYIELDGQRSNVVMSGPSSVIQGSKLSGILYTIYTNEVPRIQKLMLNPEVMKHLADSNTVESEDMDHQVTNFVDDSNSAIVFTNEDDINPYITAYMKLLSGYYNMNKLKINESKTNLMILKRFDNSSIKKKTNIVIKDEKIIPKKQFKILGYITNEKLSLESQANKICKNINFKISAVSSVSKYMDENTRLRFANSHLINTINYGLPLFLNEPKYIRNKLHTALMRCGRFVKASYCYNKVVQVY